MNSSQLLNSTLNEPRSNASRICKMARFSHPVLLVFAFLGIPAFIVLLASTLWLPTKAKAWGNTVALPAGVASPAATSTPSPAEIQKAIEVVVDASLQRDELLLDKLLLLVGLYSTILSFLALATVIVSRQDAKEQLASVTAKADSLAAEVRRELADIQKKALTDVGELKA